MQKVYRLRELLDSWIDLHQGSRVHVKGDYQIINRPLHLEIKDITHIGRVIHAELLTKDGKSKGVPVVIKKSRVLLISEPSSMLPFIPHLMPYNVLAVEEHPEEKDHVIMLQLKEKEPESTEDIKELARSLAYTLARSFHFGRYLQVSDINAINTGKRPFDLLLIKKMDSTEDDMFSHIYYDTLFVRQLMEAYKLGTIKAQDKEKYRLFKDTFNKLFMEYISNPEKLDKAEKEYRRSILKLLKDHGYV